MDVLESLHSNFLVVSLSFLLAYAFLFHHSLLQSTAGPPRSKPLLRPLLTFLVIAHTLHTLRLLLAPPTNLFTLLNLPLTAPVSAIRVALLEHQRSKFIVGFQNNISPDVEVLLTRLASFEARVIYVRYGPYPLSECAPCVHLSDFALFALAPTVLPYLRGIILVSIVTSRPTSRDAWRTPSLFVLAATFFTEIWWTVDGTVQFQDGKLTGWTHTHTYLARYTILLLLPLLVHHLPAHSSPSAIPPFFTISRPRPSFPHLSSDFRLTNGVPTPETPKRTNPTLSRSFSAPGVTQTGPSMSGANVQPHQPNSPFTTLNGTLASLSTTISTLRVLEWTRLAGLRRRDLREQISDYHATADKNATYARSDAELQREAEQLGMGYKIKNQSRKGKEREWTGSSIRQRFGGNQSTWHGNGNPRGGDTDGVDEELGNGRNAHRGPERAYQEREKENSESETEMENSPLRAKARKAARELADTYLLGTKGPPQAGAGANRMG